MDNELMGILNKYGYTSQRAVARALHEKIDHYISGSSNLRTTTVFLNQVLNGKKPVPSHLADGLLQLCDGDSDLQDVLEKRILYESKDGSGYHLIKVLDNYFDELRTHYIGVEDSEKLDILRCFVTFVQDCTHVDSILENMIEVSKGENK